MPRWRRAPSCAPRRGGAARAGAELTTLAAAPASKQAAFLAKLAASPTPAGRTLFCCGHYGGTPQASSLARAVLDASPRCAAGLVGAPLQADDAYQVALITAMARGAASPRVTVNLTAYYCEAGVRAAATDTALTELTWYLRKVRSCDAVARAAHTLTKLTLNITHAKPGLALPCVPVLRRLELEFTGEELRLTRALFAHAPRRATTVAPSLAEFRLANFGERGAHTFTVDASFWTAPHGVTRVCVEEVVNHGIALPTLRALGLIQPVPARPPSCRPPPASPG